MPNRFEDKLKGKLEGYQPEYNPADWDAMNDMLDGKSRRGGAWWNNRYAMAALLLLLAGAVSAIFLISPTSDNNPAVATHVVDSAEQETLDHTLQTKPKTDAHNSSLTLSESTPETNQVIYSEDIKLAKEEKSHTNQLTAAESAIQSSEKLAPASSNEFSGKADLAAANSSRSQPAAGMNAELDMAASSVAADHVDAASNADLFASENGEDFLTSVFKSNSKVPWVRSAGIAHSASGDFTLSSKEVDDRWMSPEQKKKKVAVHYAVFAQGGLNSTHTALGDGFRPSWDVGIGAELHLNKFYLQSGLRYGQYQFDQTDVNCEDAANFGISSADVTCASNLRGDVSMLEIPLMVGVRKVMKRANGQFRFQAGPVMQYYRDYDYTVRFEDVEAGENLFFEPYLITSVEDQDAVEVNLNSLSESADGLALAGFQPNNMDNGPVNNSRGNMAVALEAGMGYEQFLGKHVSLSAEPRLTVPMSTLLVNDRRTMVASMTARLRWYPSRAAALQ